MSISEEVQPLLRKIETRREQLGRMPKEADLIALFSGRELDTVLSAEEAAAIASTITGRRISTDYIKRLRLVGRLKSKKISERAHIYRLRDVLHIEFRETYTTKPPGRPKRKKNQFSANV